MNTDNNNNNIANIIKEWIIVNNQLKQKQKEITLLRKEQKNKTGILLSLMKENEIDEFDINTGKLIYSKTRSKAPLSKKHLIDSLAKFYKNDTELVGELTKYIMESREEKVKEFIKHKD